MTTASSTTAATSPRSAVVSNAAVPPTITGSLQNGATPPGGTTMDDERRLSNSQLFARWAGEDIASWQRATGASVTHLSRGVGQVTSVSQDAGIISVNVQYERSARGLALWEFRTELIAMTYPVGVTRDELSPPVKARRLLQEQAARAQREVFR